MPGYLSELRAEITTDWVLKGTVTGGGKPFLAGATRKLITKQKMSYLYRKYIHISYTRCE